VDYRYVSTVPNPVLVISIPDAHVLHVNPAGREQWGFFEARSFEGLALSRLLTPVDKRNASALATFLGGRDGLVVHLTADVTTTDLRQRRCQFVGRAGIEEEPNVGLLAAVDVSEQNALFRTLEEEARRLRALVKSNFDAYYIWHIAGRYHEWSEQMDRLLGLPPDRSFADFEFSEEAWLARLHPSQREPSQDLVHACIEEGRPYQDEYLLRREDGEYRLVADRGVLLFDNDGTPTQLVGVIRDITEERAGRRDLEQSEELYRTLFEATSNPALRTDAHGRCIEANKAACEFLSLSNEQLLQTDIGDHFGSLATETLKKLSRGQPQRQQAVVVEFKVGEGDDERTLVTSVIPSPVADRTTYFWLGTDVTSLRRLNAALEESRQSLSAEVKAREEYSVALKVIMEQGRQETVAMRQVIRDNFDRLVAPMLDRLDKYLKGRPEAAYLDAVRETVAEIANSVGGLDMESRDPMQGPLTRKEVEIARLVKMGKSTDEIANILHIAPATVSYHRKKIRRKFGIRGEKVRLDSYLLDGGSDR
jgi:PAS domain S-box-containing protein